MLYRIDTDDRLAEFNDAWLAFAEANEGQALHPSSALGRSLWEFLADDTTIHLYQVMVQRLRDGGPPIRFRFRCDAPRTRRLLAMEITAEDRGSVRFSVTSSFEESRPPVALLEPAHSREKRLLTMCGWCKRVRLPADRWVEIEKAVEELRLFEGVPMPTVTHGMCPPCYEAIIGAIRDRALGAAGTVTLGAIHAA